MNSVVTRRFRKSFRNLPQQIQEKAKKSYQIWKSNPNHPSLQFKQIHPNPINLLSASWTWFPGHWDIGKTNYGLVLDRFSF